MVHGSRDKPAPADRGARGERNGTTELQCNGTTEGTTVIQDIAIIYR